VILKRYYPGCPAPPLLPKGGPGSALTIPSSATPPPKTRAVDLFADIDNPSDIHYVTSVYAAFEFIVEPVVDVMDGVAAQAKAIEYLKKNGS
jgi:hypothetical protein